MLTRYLGLLEENGLTETVPGDGMAVQEFTDASQISDWAADSVAFCLEEWADERQHGRFVRSAGQCASRGTGAGFEKHRLGCRPVRQPQKKPLYPVDTAVFCLCRAVSQKMENSISSSE